MTQEQYHVELVGLGKGKLSVGCATRLPTSKLVHGTFDMANFYQLPVTLQQKNGSPGTTGRRIHCLHERRNLTHPSISFCFVVLLRMLGISPNRQNSHQQFQT